MRKSILRIAAPGAQQSFFTDEESLVFEETRLDPQDRRQAFRLKLREAQRKAKPSLLERILACK